MQRKIQMQVCGQRVTRDLGALDDSLADSPALEKTISLVRLWISVTAGATTPLSEVVVRIA